jgi:hypothetical protein
LDLLSELRFIKHSRQSLDSQSEQRYDFRVCDAMFDKMKHSVSAGWLFSDNSERIRGRGRTVWQKYDRNPFTAALAGCPTAARRLLST